ncbi:MAG: hypothetical protein ACOYEV_17430 [Candidatus Nanopelagicales bacterium]
MNRSLARIAAKLAAPAVGIGLVVGMTGVFALATPTEAVATTGADQSQTCVTSTGVGAAKAGAPSPMTRAGQVNYSAPSAASAPVSCSGH